MPPTLTISHLSRSHWAHGLFKDACLQINRGDRVALIGTDGIGKTTLFSIITGKQKADEGSVILNRRASVGFLPQETAPSEEERFLETAQTMGSELVETLATLQSQRARGDLESDHNHETQAAFIVHDSHRIEAKTRRVPKGLAFRNADMDQPMLTFSGSWTMRAHFGPSPGAGA